MKHPQLVLRGLSILKVTKFGHVYQIIIYHLQLFHMLLSIAFTQNYDSWSLMFWAAIFTFKLWGRSDSDRFMYDFDVYHPVPDDWVSEPGRSAGVVEKMTDSLPDEKNLKAFADNYFSSVRLLKS
jgi:hypothetical protein